MSDSAMGQRNVEKSQDFDSLRNFMIFIVGCLVFVLNGCQPNSESHHETAAPASQKIVAAERKPIPRHCPDAPYPMLQAKDPATGHHRVFLKWGASRMTGDADPNELGYCLYRTQKPGRAKDCPKKYPKCEQVNFVPVSGTRCVDELVKDNSTYYYVVIAVTSTGTSIASEEAIAEVPAAGKRNPPPPDDASYPACRTPIPPSHAPDR